MVKKLLLHKTNTILTDFYTILFIKYDSFIMQSFNKIRGLGAKLWTRKYREITKEFHPVSKREFPPDNAHLLVTRGELNINLTSTLRGDCIAAALLSCRHIEGGILHYPNTFRKIQLNRWIWGRIVACRARTDTQTHTQKHRQNSVKLHLSCSLTERGDKNE